MQKAYDLLIRTVARGLASELEPYCDDEDFVERVTKAVSEYLKISPLPASVVEFAKENDPHGRLGREAISAAIEIEILSTI